MTQFYAIRNDGVKFQALDLEILDITRHLPNNIELHGVLEFSQKNTAMSAWWKTPETEFINIEGEPTSPIPDISLWIDATLVLSPKAYRMLSEILKVSGEFLPVTVGDETYYIFNCFTLGEEDETKSKFEQHEGVSLGLEYLTFKESAAELLIFKSSLQSCLTLFCGDRFKNAVDSFELTGIIFDKNLIEVF